MGDLPLVENEAVVPEDIVRLDQMTYKVWGPPLTLPQYLQRERLLRAVPFSRGLRTWVLREGDKVLASCESYAVPLSLHGPRPRDARHGLVHGIASVYVEESLRGHGYASTMLRGVAEQLGQQGVLGCYLMSEIGPSLYARLGYVARPLRCCRYAAANPVHEPLPTPLPWTWLQEDALAGLLQQRYAATQPALCITTTPAQIGWHLARSRYYARVLHRKPSPYIGAQVKASDGGAFAIWQPSYPHDVLRVLMLYPGDRLAQPGAPVLARGPELAAVRNVLHAARFVAAELELGHIEVWENAWNSASLRGGARVPASDVPMLLPLHPAVRPEDWVDYERCHWL
jgi:hypothetical protein